LLFPSFGDPVQKFQDLVSGKAFDASFPEILAESGESASYDLTVFFCENSQRAHSPSSQSIHRDYRADFK